MEVELGFNLLRTHIGDDRVSSVVSAGAASTDVHLAREHVREFALG